MARVTSKMGEMNFSSVLPRYRDGRREGERGDGCVEGFVCVGVVGAEIHTHTHTHMHILQGIGELRES